MKISANLHTETTQRYDGAGDIPVVSRKLTCCPGWSKVGDSLLRIAVKAQGGVIQYLYLHRECLLKAIEQMPLSESEEEITRRFDGLREAIRESGKLFPEEHYVLEHVQRR